MSQVQPQVDIGQLTFGSLSAFAPILAAVTADNVAPMAMIQLEQLGAAFPISGPKAAQVADCLQRFTSTKLERLGILIGWRKGDTASFMAKSSSGQAIALLATCIGEIFPDQYGTILYTLSERMLSPSSAVASPSQLRAGCDLLKAKLACLGFGNVIAKQMTRVYDAYKHLEMAMPTDLLDSFSVETAVDLLHAISRALREEQCIVRISGTSCLGYILSAVMMLFPDDAMVSVENYVIHEGPRRSILIEVTSQSSELPPQIAVEDLLDYSQTVNLPIVPEPESDYIASQKSFSWDGWIANRIRVEFLARGLQCPKELLLACCTLLVLLSETIPPQSDASGAACAQLPGEPIYELLGSYARHRIMQTCQTVFQVPPFEPQHSLEESYTILTNMFEAIVPRSKKDCCTRDDALDHCWRCSKVNNIHVPCPMHGLWKVIGWALAAGLGCFFIVPGPNAVLEPAGLISINGAPNPITRLVLHHAREEPMSSELNSAGLYQIIMDTIFPDNRSYLVDRVPRPLALSNSCTLYPSLLREPVLDSEGGIRFELVDGQIQHRKRSYLSISGGIGGSKTRQASESLYTSESGGVKPTSCGIHSYLEFSLQPIGYDFHGSELQLRTTAGFSGQIVPINLGCAILGAYGVRQAQPCAHPRDSPLSSDLAECVITTSFAAPVAKDKRMSIVQTAGNPTAQLLACQAGANAILQKWSCLNCAYREAIADTKANIRMIIAG